MDYGADTPTMMNCNDHGVLRPAYICRHLRRGKKLGFFAMTDESDPQTKQGQCFRCGMISLIVGSIPIIGYRIWVWYSRPEMVCSECFENIRERNTRKK